ncbi:hypothetical protein COHA_006876 [Chlorella ohadii]|uniref:Uncharacterized protein n=1 Tax=Chlorella ohadii TaxID=2649997 RepID=A0AAD5DJZ6_9CHLO|nr:hypothetical protein COHA_006876 [Chlorella ohadii]
MQGRRGAGRKLRDLSAEKLGRRIQLSGRRHSPREDAQAALDLYIQHIHFERRNWSYEDLVEQELAAILASASGSVDDSSAEEGGVGSSGGGN